MTNNTSLDNAAFWRFLGAPIVGNASFLATFLHGLAIAFRWFLRTLLALLAVGVVLGGGSLILGALRPGGRGGGGGSKEGSGESGDASGDSGDLVELEFLTTDYEYNYASDGDDGD